MAWGMIGGAAVGLVGNVAGGTMDANNAAQAAQEDRELLGWKTEVAQQNDLWAAELGREQYAAGMENTLLRDQNQVAAEMYSSKYSVANQQARYDAFQEQFGDVKDNVNNYFRTLSASSVKAQNIDDINARMAGVDARLTQTLAERGISSSSGVAIQALGQSMIEGETAKVMANRNVDTEIAQAKDAYLQNQANDPLLARAPDFDAGMLTEEQRTGFVDPSQATTTYDIPEQSALPKMPEVKAPEATGLGGFLSSIF